MMVQTQSRVLTFDPSRIRATNNDATMLVSALPAAAAAELAELIRDAALHRVDGARAGVDIRIAFELANRLTCSAEIPEIVERIAARLAGGAS
jgi:hypothetical protein